MKHRKSENKTRQQKQQPTTVTILMLICRGDIHPNLELFDQVEVTWPIHPLFRSGEAFINASAHIPNLLLTKRSICGRFYLYY